MKLKTKNLIITFALLILASLNAHFGHYRSAMGNVISIPVLVILVTGETKHKSAQVVTLRKSKVTFLFCLASYLNIQ